MRDGIIGIIVGIVVGVVLGATVIAPRLEPELKDQAAQSPAPRPSSPAETAPTAEAAAPAFAGRRLRWKMASAYGGDLPQLGALAKRVGRQIALVSGGAFEIEFLEPGRESRAAAAGGDMFDAVASGAIDAAFAASAAWGGKFPALDLFSSIPFGPPAEEYLAWIFFGGGEQLANAIYERKNTHAVFCGIIAPEAGGWFRKPVSTVEDLKGLRMRISGLGAKVAEKLDMEAVSLDEGDIFLALEQGAIDAAEFSMPAIDLKLNFHKLANYYYFPGWQQPSTLFTLLINLDRWNGLTAAQRAQVESVCGDNVRYGLAEGEALQYGALKELTKEGVQILTWPAAVLEAFRQAWGEVAAELAAADKDFAKIWESLRAFRQDYAIWKELGRL